MLDDLGAKRVEIVAKGTQGGPAALVDLDDKFIPFMEKHGIDTMLVRPDFYLCGAVGRARKVNGLVDDLASDLERHGVRTTAALERESLAA